VGRGEEQIHAAIEHVRKSWRSARASAGPSGSMRRSSRTTARTFPRAPAPYFGAESFAARRAVQRTHIFRSIEARAVPGPVVARQVGRRLGRRDDVVGRDRVRRVGQRTSRTAAPVRAAGGSRGRRRGAPPGPSPAGSTLSAPRSRALERLGHGGQAQRVAVFARRVFGVAPADHREDAGRVVHAPAQHADLVERGAERTRP